MTLEQWLKLGYQFFNKETQTGFDQFSNGIISLNSFFDIACEAYLKQRNTPSIEYFDPCYGCSHYETCLYSVCCDHNKTTEENIEEFCTRCPCNGECGCNQNDGCSNYEIYPMI